MPVITFSNDADEDSLFSVLKRLHDITFRWHLSDGSSYVGLFEGDQGDGTFLINLANEYGMPTNRYQRIYTEALITPEYL